MSLLARIFPAVAREERATAQDLDQWVLDRLARPGAMPFGGTPSTALTLSAVWACTRLLADNLSAMPADVYGADGLERDRPQVLREPTPGVPLAEWLWGTVAALELRGNSYSLVVDRDRLGHPTQLQAVAPDRVSVERTAAGVLRYRVGTEAFDRSDVVHLRANVMPGDDVGLSTLAYAARSVGVGLSSQKFTEDFFNNGAHPTGVLRSERTLTQAGAEQVKERVREATRHRDVLALGEGLTLDSFGVSPKDALLVEVAQWSTGDVCRFFGVPAEMVGGESSGSLTYSNREQRALEFLTYTLGHRVKRLEDALSALLPPPGYVKLNPAALLRADVETRYRAHSLALAGQAWKTPDEVRALEDLPPAAPGALDVPPGTAPVPRP